MIYEGFALILRDKKRLLWAGAYPRIFPQHHGYAPPTDASVDIALLQDTLSRGRTFIEKNELYPDLVASTKIVKERVPTYYIPPGLFGLVQHPHAKIPVDWVRMKLPSETGVFVFSRRGFRGKIFDDLTFAWYARVRAGEYALPSGGYPISFAHDFFYIRLATFQSVEQQSVYAQTFAQVDTPTIQMGDPDSISEAATNVVMNMLLLMSTHPELIATGLPSGRRSALDQEYWTPTLVGRSLKPTDVEQMIRLISSVPECAQEDMLYAGETMVLQPELQKLPE
jgi:hypothetical protein